MVIAATDLYVPLPAGAIPFSAVDLPAVSVAATTTIPSPGIGKRLVITGFSATVGGGATAPAATICTVTLTTGPNDQRVLSGAVLGAPATAASISGIVRSGRWYGDEDSAVTLAFDVTATNVEQSVAIEGHEEAVEVA